MIQFHKPKIKIIVSILLFSCGILFFSLAVQKYQVLTSSQAMFGLPRCEIPEAGATPLNTPCASCDVFEGTNINEMGDVTVAFGCKVQCNDSGNPLDMNGCGEGVLPYSVSTASWFWCRGSGTHACTEQNELTGDLIAQLPYDALTEGGPWIVAMQGDTDFTANINIPGYANCGRVQIDLETNEKASYVINSEVDCDEYVVAQGVDFPTPTFGFDFPEGTLTPTPIIQQPTLPPPTHTRTPTPSPTATIIPTQGVSITPTVAVSVTSTVSPTASPLPTATYTPTPTPSPTFTPIPTATPTTMPTPITEITVNGEAPGITSWVMMLTPVAVILLGLLL